MIRKIIRFLRQISEIKDRVYNIQEAIGRIETRQIQVYNSRNLLKSQFKVFSQWGEDGLIQFLISNINFCNNKFIEFGVEDYYECNTRFLLSNNKWSGLVIDADSKCIEKIKKDKIYWSSNLKAVNKFITKDNINSIIEENGFAGEIGILSIDVDGNDYWIFKAINIVNPDLIIIEYNSLFGKTYPLTVPYDENFIRNKKHFSNMYYGASICALNELASEKGYSLIASNNVGNNLFFLRNNLIGDIKKLTVEEAYTKSVFRESKNKKGELTFEDFNESVKLISNLELYNTLTHKTVFLKDLNN